MPINKSQTVLMRDGKTGQDGREEIFLKSSVSFVDEKTDGSK